MVRENVNILGLAGERGIPQLRIQFVLSDTIFVFV